MKNEEQRPEVLRIVIADDHLIVREGLRTILEDDTTFAVVGEASDGASAVRQAQEKQPDVVLMDLRMPGMDGLQAIEQIHCQWPQMAIVILTTYDDDELMLRSLRAGAIGYLLKDTSRETLFSTLRAAARSETLLPSARMRHLLSSHKNEERTQTGRERETGAPVLTQRESEVLARVARGERNKDIAAHLGISEPTVKTHLVGLYAKLGVDSRASAVAVAIEKGLLALPTKISG